MHWMDDDRIGMNVMGFLKRFGVWPGWTLVCALALFSCAGRVPDSAQDLTVPPGPAPLVVDSLGWNVAVKYDTFTDVRDGKVYRTIKIGHERWMAQNLDFESDSSWCYERNKGYCKKFGRLYQWSAASKACPEGWHLPTGFEWGTILGRLDSNRVMAKLISAQDWGLGDTTKPDFAAVLSKWIKPIPPRYVRKVEKIEPSWVAIDTLGFRALPAGIRSKGFGESSEALMLTQSTRTRTYGAEFGLKGTFAYFWSMTDFDGFYAWGPDRRYVLSVLSRNLNVDRYGFSVRCVED